MIAQAKEAGRFARPNANLMQTPGSWPQLNKTRSNDALAVNCEARRGPSAK